MSKGEFPLPIWVPRFKSGDPFLKTWGQTECADERRRVMLRSRIGAFGPATELHDLVTDFLLLKGNASLDTMSPVLQVVEKITGNSPARTSLAEAIEGRIAKQFVELMTKFDAAKKLRELAEIVDLFPAHKGNLDFGDCLSTPDWFKPTIQDGLKAVMLGAFFALVEKRPLGPESLPTICELDSAIREKWKWSGGEKELRDARRELGLSGLPRGKSGRPKKR